MYIDTYIHTYIRTYIHTYIHAYIHVHTHIHDTCTFISYADCLITSGAIQNGVPTKVNLFIVSVNCPATPKSANLTSPLSDKRTFAAVKDKRD